jgi:outer membrane immunogenic protein
VLGGVQAGYNWQVTNYQVTNYLVGVETDFQGSAQKDTATSAGVFSLPIFFFFGAQVPSPVIVANTTQLDWFGTARGRLGVVNGGWLVYATGGLAYGDVKSSSAVNPVTIAARFPNVPFTLGTSAVRAGASRMRCRIIEAGSSNISIWTWAM